MNKQRRKILAEIIAALEAVEPDLERLSEDEREAFDNMPEGLQQGENGQRASDAADAIEEAFGDFQNVLDSLRGIE